MNQQPWTPPSRSGGGGGAAGGSVRRARERMEADTPSDMPQLPPQQQRGYNEQPRQQRTYYEQMRPAPSQPSQPQSQIPRAKPQMPSALAGTRNALAPVGVAISRPTQVPQWPLAGTIETVQDSRGNQQQYQPPPGRSNPPQRPPRPSHVPSMLDASRLQDHTPSFQYKPQQEQSQGRGQVRYQEDEDDFVTSPMTQVSRSSTISSVGTIPDFPVPMPPPPAAGPRRSANLGPPPTARRGGSSYYSQTSYVSPIPEESPRSLPSHGSYASSAAIPENWGADSPGYDYEERFDDRDRGFGHETIEEGRESRESNDNDDTGLIRSASFGKRAKPSLITTRSSSGDRAEQQRPGPAPQQKSKLERMGVVGAVAAAATAGSAMTAGRVNNNSGQRETVWPMVGDPGSPLAGGTGLIDKSTSSSETDVPTLSKGPKTDSRSPPPLETETLKALREKEMLGAYNAASSLSPGGATPTRTPSPGFSRLSAIRRPPKLDIDAVRDAEARGSLTSLPDLIRRATRLAAMMDRGKRPASRLALDDFPSDRDLSRDKELDASPEEKRQSGFSGMLAAFPPPGLATPRDGTPRPVSAWPAGYDDPSTPGNGGRKPKKNGRRCCGLPCWGALLLLLILLIIIAAAVVIPLEFLVLRKPKAAPAALTPVQRCQQDNTTACQNGGNSFSTDGVCSCLCINGFTGSTCSVASTAGCTTMTLNSDYPNVTIGDAIPRLISAAQSNFSIPLFSTIILTRFNAANLSCLSENALVTFDGLSQRIGAANAVVIPSSTPTPTNARRRHRRDESSSAADAGATENVIMVDKSSTPPLPSPTTPAENPTPSTTPTDTPSSTPTTEPFVVTETVLDFARTAVLFILQQQSLDDAVTAQSSLQRFFSTSPSPLVVAAGNISVGAEASADLVRLVLDLGGGSFWGVGYNSTAVGRRGVDMMAL